MTTDLDTEALSVAWENITGYDSTWTIERVYPRTPNGAYQCIWPNCRFARKDSDALWHHVHTAHGPHSLPPNDWSPT